MKFLIDSVGLIMLLALAISMITCMTIGTMRFVLAPIFLVPLEPRVGMVTFLVYTILWLLSIFVNLRRNQ